MAFHATCLECKNDITLDQGNLQVGDHFECDTCGITLEARQINGSEIEELEIVELEK